MTELLTSPKDARDLPGGPCDLEFFLDPLALCTLAGFPDFAEIKRTKRPPLDLPVLRR